LLFVGRIQPLKGPEVLVKAAAELLARHPSWGGELEVVVLGGPSGSGLAHPHALDDLAQQLGIAAQVRFVKPVPRAELAQWYRAADLVAVPSHSESFGLVAVEAQACGTPVVAADVGGLPTAVGEAGILVDGHQAPKWADALESLLLDPERREVLSHRAVAHAALFGWDRTTERLYEVYVEACRARAHGGDSPSPNGSLAGVPSAVVP
jgi:D-inositol-3-phosphate glycosyltransferase